MRRVAIVVVVLLALVVAKPNGQTATTPLTNADVVKMVAARLGDAVIITAIERSPRRTFDVTVDGLIGLKQAGVPDAVIAVMQRLPAEKTSAPPLPPPPASPVAPEPRPTPPADGIPPQEPSGVFEAFRVDPATGELIPLEPAKMKTNPSARTVYLVGPGSPVVFKYGEPLVIAFRTVQTPEKLKDQTKNHRQFQIEHLAVKDGKRYATKVYVPLAIESYGQPKSGLVPGQKNMPAQSYLFTPRTQLPPGEYAFTYGGLIDEGSFGAFAIADR